MAEENKIINDFLPLKAEQKFTKAPNRLSDTSICSELEKLSILRPSQAGGQITKVLLNRKYITMQKGSITVTDLGIRVVDFLVESDFNFINFKFTADMEADLDLIAEGKKKRTDLLQFFYTSLLHGLQKAQNIKEEKQKTNFKCPKCGGFLVKKNSKFGTFFSCQNYKTVKKIKENSKTKNKTEEIEGCQYKASVGDHGEPVEKIKEEIIESKIKCDSCEELLLVRKSKKGNEYLSCRNWKNKPCAGFYDITGKKMDFSKKKKWYKKKNA